MIIKDFDENEKLVFYITNNKLNSLITIKNEKEFKIYINISNEEKTDIEAKCYLPKIDSLNEYFKIKCYFPDETSIEDEIEISEEPQDDEYNFIGFKNKRTLTLESGSIEKKDKNNFKIINNKFIGDTKIEINIDAINMEIYYSDKESGSAQCSIDIEAIKNINSNDIDMTRKIQDEIKDPKTIFITNNPEKILLSDEITTLN